MFDRDRATAAVGILSALERGQLATLCLARLAELMKCSKIHDAYPAVSGLVDQVLRYAVASAQQQESLLDPDLLDAELRDFLGSDEEPEEELPGWGACAMDISSVSDYALRTWRYPNASEKNCFQVMLGAYSSTGFLEDSSIDPDVPVLSEMEVQRQMTDADEIRQGASWDHLLQESANLAEMYRS